MSNLKQRIEGLKTATNSAEAISVCNEALKQIKEYSQFNLSTDATQQFEAKVADDTILALEAIDESATKNFIHIENRIQGMDNLGVKKGLRAIAESAIASHPAAMYRFKKLAGAETQPEWLVIENVIDALKGFDWDPTVKAAVSEMETNFGKYKEDIKIYKAVYEAKNSRSEFLIAGLQKDIDKYLNERTASNRAALIEKLNSFNYDPNIRALYNTVLESEKSFQLKAGSNDAIVSSLYSPVILAEGVEIFSVYGKAYAKSGNNITPLTEEETKGLPEHFNFISTFLAQPNVKVTENHVTIFSKDKKVEIIEEADELKIYINGKNVSMNEFHSVYLNSGMFRFEEKDTLTAVNKIVENWDSIFELDFAKSIFPKSIPTRRADIFKLNEKTYINTVDIVMNENKFYPNCNATQSRTMILEFAHYDLGLTFTDVLVKEEAVLNKLEESKKEFLDAIAYLETRKNLLENHENTEIRESEEVKEILSAIDEEISTLKAEYFNVQNEITALKTANEGVTVGDEVEVGEEKKKAVITGYSDSDKIVTIKLEDGSSKSVKPNEIKVIKKASEARPGNDLELQTQNDGATVGIREANDVKRVGKDVYVPARISNTYTDTQLASKPCLVKSIDYTSKGDADKIEIMIGEQKFMIEKKFVTDVKLNETGVYNSETDKENNPKTGENKPDELTGMVSKLIDSVAGVIGSLEDIKDMVEENSSLSYTALETCIAELQSYVKSLEDESDVSAQASAN